MDKAVVVPWFNLAQKNAFLRAWGVTRIPPWLIMQQDENQEGCATTKNKGIWEAIRREAEVVVVLDDDCYPAAARDLEHHIELHVKALQPQDVNLFEIVTEPPSRGTPYGDRSVRMPVAASMGFWEGIGDYCAVRQLAFDTPEMEFKPQTVFGRWFPLSGMNLAFRPKDWQPWCEFIDVPRFDDIWMGWLWQYYSYSKGHCFNLNGPAVRHARQSNPWRNLAFELDHLEANETLWKKIALHPQGASYEEMLALLPSYKGGSDR